MIRDGVDWAGKMGEMGMGENTHEDTYRYFNISRTKFKEMHSILGGVWLANLERKVVIDHILQPWLDCGIHACYTCMAPPGSTKALPDGMSIQGPPSTTYLAHRQDQSVLSLLVYQSQVETSSVVIRIDDEEYLNIVVSRKSSTHNMTKLLQNIQ